MAKGPIRIYEIRPGKKGALWAGKVAWNRTGFALAIRSKRILEAQPAQDKIIAALREIQAGPNQDTPAIERIVGRLAAQRRGLVKLQRDLAGHIARAKPLGEETAGLKSAEREAGSNVTMIDTLLAEFLHRWASHPETVRLVRQIMAQRPAKKKKKQK